MVNLTSACDNFVKKLHRVLDFVFLRTLREGLRFINSLSNFKKIPRYVAGFLSYNLKL